MKTPKREKQIERKKKKEKERILWIWGLPFTVFEFKRFFETKNRKMKCVENQFVIDRSISPYHRIIHGTQKCHLFGAYSFEHGLGASHPRMLQDFGDGDSTIHISIEHSPNQMDAIVGKRKERNSKRMIQYLVDVVEWVFLINNGV